jgi:hypothetical protein
MERLKEIYPNRNIEIRNTAKANVGSTGSGVVVRRDSDLMVIDVTPCSDKKALMRFHQEYRESPISDIRCPNGEIHHRSKVRQK